MPFTGAWGHRLIGCLALWRKVAGRSLRRTQRPSLQSLNRHRSNQVGDLSPILVEVGFPEVFFLLAQTLGQMPWSTT